MAAVDFPPQFALSVRNTFVHCSAEDTSLERPVAARPRSKTGPASLFSNLLLEADMDDAPEGACAFMDSQFLDETGPASETEERQDDEPHFQIRSIKTRDFFEDTPVGALSVRTSDPFEDTPLQEMPKHRFGFALSAELAPPSLPAPGERSEPKQAASGTDEPGGAQLRGEAAANIQVRNTFVHFGGEEGEDTPGRRAGPSRRSRTTRTVPARILEGALLQEELDAERGVAAALLASTSPRAETALADSEGLPTLLQQPQDQQCYLAADVRKATLAAAAAAADPGSARGRAAQGAPEPALGGAPRAEAAAPGPMYVERAPSTLEVEGGKAAGTTQPCKVPLAQEQPGDANLQGQVAGLASAMAVPPGMCAPASLAPGAMHPFFAGFNPLVPLWPQMSVAQAVQFCQAAAVHAGQSPPPELAEVAGAAPATGGGPSRRTVGERTTVVLQNLPLNYRRPMLLRMLDSEGFSGQYDFVYLPMDFKTRAGFGYAFINLVNADAVSRFWRVFDGYKKWMFPSAKVCTVSWSVPHQGLKAHLKRYRNSPLMHESVPDEYKPVLFSGGTRVSFPPPTKELAAPSQQALVKAPKRSRRQVAA